MASNHRPKKMHDWVEKLDAFLKFNEREILDDFGKVSAEVAKQLAEKEFIKYRIEQDSNFISDFDLEIKKYLKAS